jgi:integral membrane protein (TIGR00529 family)
MADILKLSAVFLLLVLLLRRKANTGLVMLAGAGLLALLYAMPPGALLQVLGDTLTDGITVKLTAALLLIRVLEVVLREKRILARMTEASRALLRSRRAAIVSMPLLIGMLPSVGGAYFSAPMVDEATRETGMSREEKGFVNYWFRHPWEFVLPLYPGLVLAAALSGIGLRGLIAANLSYAAVMAASGLLLSMRRLKPRPAEPAPPAGPAEGNNSRRHLAPFLPIASVLALVMLFDLELSASLALVTALLFLLYRYRPPEVLRALRNGFSLDVILLISGVMVFKGVMETSGAVENLSAFLTGKHIPLTPMLFLLPFITGVLTGLTIGFVSATFPLLLSLSGGDTLGAVSFAFAAGFTGVLLSPVHVCLILTREYFRARMGGIYVRLLLPAALIMAVAAIQYRLLG